MGNIGAQFVELFTANKWLRWSVFWFGWLWISPETIIPGAIAVGVGNVFYKERAVNLVTICAAYLGILGYLMLGHIGTSGQKPSDSGWAWRNLRAHRAWSSDYPWFGWCMLVMIAAAFNGAGRRRR